MTTPSDTHLFCSSCNKHLPIDNFYSGGRKKNGEPKARKKPCRECRYKVSKRWTERNRGRIKEPLLPVGPLREHLAQMLARGEYGPGSLSMLIGVAPRNLYGILYENEKIKPNVADRIVCNLGDPHLFNELWPL